MNKKNLIPMMLLIVASIMVVSSCKKKSNDPAPTPTPTTPTNGAPAITSSFYFQAKIDGNWVTLQDGINGYASGTSNSGGTQEEQSALIIKYGAIPQGAYFFILKTFTGTPTGPDYESMFGVRSYNYGISIDFPNGIDGAGIGYMDANGTDWRSDFGAATQTGSTFSIVEHIVNPDGYSHKISKATFSCKLYDGNGNSKTLTDGVLRGRSVLY